MTALSMIVIALALAMDAFAVSLSIGLRFRQLSFAQTFKIALVFGGFQCIMPLIGWLFGIAAKEYAQACIGQYDHWIAFILLAIVGSHMIVEAGHQPDEKETQKESDPTKGIALWILGLATSIDALAVGLSMSLVKADICLAAIIIGVVCFILSIVGSQIGKQIASLSSLNRLGNRAYILGGLVLWIIGLKLLYEHGVFS